MADREIEKVNIAQKFSLFDDYWVPYVVGELNESYVKVDRMKGEFVWHSHPETDELFMVLEGEMVIDFRDGESPLSAGNMIIVPKGVQHRPRASDECHVLLVEPVGTKNTGDAGGELTAEDDVWI